jgi:hypothetical protein
MQIGAIKRMPLNAKGPDGLIDRKPPGQPPKLNTARMIDDGPVPGVHAVMRWRLVYLIAWV